MDNHSLQRVATRGNTCPNNPGLWALRDTRFGGLNHRYTGKHLKLLRTVDPFRASGVEFKSPLHLDNWLLRNFTPMVTECDTKCEGLKFIEGGKSRTVSADLLTTFKDGIRVVDLVIPASRCAAPSEWYRLEQVAVAFGIVPALRTKEEIRSNPILLQNLDRWCQHGLVNMVIDLNFQDEVLKVVPAAGAMTVADILKELKASRNPLVTQEHLDSALICLYRSGELRMNIADASYGAETIVQSA